MALNSLYNTWHGALRSLGLNQQRCAHCLGAFYREYPAPLQASSMLCPTCQDLMQVYAGPRCLFCGVPSGPDLMAEKTTPRILCAQCRINPPPWSSFAYHGLYAGALRDMILRLKFDGELHLGRFFGELLLEASKCLPAPDAILAVPQTNAHLRARGFNQAHEIARSLARLGGFSLKPRLLARIKRGRPQEMLSARERRENLRGAFAASPEVSGLTLWLIDDVMTTGSTYFESVSALLAQNARQVCALFVARTPVG